MDNIWLSWMIIYLKLVKIYMLFLDINRYSIRVWSSTPPPPPPLNNACLTNIQCSSSCFYTQIDCTVKHTVKRIWYNYELWWQGNPHSSWLGKFWIRIKYSCVLILTLINGIKITFWNACSVFLLANLNSYNRYVFISLFRF